MTPVARTQLVKTLARDVGFDLVGVTPVEPLHRAVYYRDWLAAGYGGSMAYLGRNVPFRAEPARLLPGARSAICVGLSYKRPDGHLNRAREHSGAAFLGASALRPTGLIAQYARGRDYHRVLRDMLNTLVARLQERLRAPFEARIFVDTGPLLERELAAAAGLGWIGKNTCLLHARLGSYVLLGEALSTLDLAPDDPLPDRCGSCTRCLAACPTQAFIGPYRLDASRCIAYLTIEHAGKIPEPFHAALGDRVFGCDVCQQVCPYNARAPHATQPDIAANVTPARVDLLALLNLTNADYRRLTRSSATARARRNAWRRNAAIALGNLRSPDEAVWRALEVACQDEDESVRQAASASVKRLSGGKRRGRATPGV